MHTHLLIGLLSLLFGATASAAQTGAPPTRLVRITAQQVSASPPRYVFLVTNLSDQPLANIYVGSKADGSGDDRRMLAGKLNTPTRVTLPEGWTASVTESGGTAFFSYHWTTVDRTKAIRPGESRCDFRVELPVFVPPKPPTYVGRKLYAQATYEDMPFLVIWADGVETEGIVWAHRLTRK